MKRTHSLAIAALALVAATASSAVGPAAGSPSSTAAGGTVVIAEPEAPDTLDPIGTSGLGVGAQVFSTVFETLVVATIQGEVVPSLATEWTVSDDGLTYTFTLRDDVTFHNGEPFEADDVVFSFERAKTEGVPAATQRFEPVTSVVAVDEHTVELTLAAPNSAFIYTLGDPTGIAAAVLNREAAEDGDTATAPVGTGPLRFVSFDPGTALVLERFDEYWAPDALPSYETLEIRYIGDDQSQLAALRSGEIDVARPTDPVTVLSTQGDSTFAQVTYPGVGFWINLSRVGATASPEVAQAVALLIDREALVDIAFLGAAQPGTTAHPFLDYALGVDDLPNYTRDVEAAKALLAEAGHADGLDLEFIWPSRNPFQTVFFETLQASLAEGGINVTLEPLEQSVWLSRFTNAEYDLSITDQAWTANPVRYLTPRIGWQAPAEEVATELPELLATLSAASEEDRPAAFQALQIYEAEQAYPFIGTVWIDSVLLYRPDRVGEPDVSEFPSSSRRLLYTSLTLV